MRDRWVLGGYVVALVVFVGIAVAAFTYFDQFDRDSSWVRHTERVLLQLERVLGGHLDAQTAVRGFLITGEDRYLTPYRGAMEKLPTELDMLGVLTRDNPSQQARTATLRTLSQEMLAFVTRTLEEKIANNSEHALELVQTGRGKLLMDRIRDMVGEMEAEETHLLRERLERAQVTAWRTSALILFGNGFAFALLGASTIMLGRELNRRRLSSRMRVLDLRGEALAAEWEAVQSRMQAVLEELPLGVMLALCPSGAVVFTNRRMSELFGGSLPELCEESDFEALHILREDGTPYPQGQVPMVRALRRGETTKSEEIQMLRADGRPIPLVVSAAPFRDGQGQVAGMVATFDDYTEAKKTREEARKAQLFRELFLRAVGHDLRNPLSVITAGAASLLRRALAEPELKVVERMASSAERMTRMVDQILGLVESRLGTGIPVERRQGDLVDIVRRAVERMEVAHPERSIRLAVDGRLGGEWDPGRMGQVVTDVIANAFEHGAPDRPVSVAVKRTGSSAIIEVHNEGDPIPEEMLPLLFDPFRRAAERKRASGFGLGLYLALQITRLHGGTIEASSDAEGTTFRIVLPL
jgi:PAS domain S-box-containing protein